MSTPASAAAAGRAPLDHAALGRLLASAAANGTGPVAVIGSRLHDLATRLVSDGVAVAVTVPGRRDARALGRAARRAGVPAPPSTVADVHIDLPFADAALSVVVCRLDSRTFPFPRHTVRELGRAIAPGGTVVLLGDDRSPWPAGLVDAWAAAAGLVPATERGMGGALPFTGAVYETRN